MASATLLKDNMCDSKYNMYCYVIIVMYAAFVIYAVIDLHAVIVTFAVTVVHAFIVISAVVVIYAVGIAICDRLSADQKDVHLLNLTFLLQRGGSRDEAGTQS